jgi:general stress protein 26
MLMMKIGVVGTKHNNGYLNIRIMMTGMNINLNHYGPIDKGIKYET